MKRYRIKVITDKYGNITYVAQVRKYIFYYDIYVIKLTSSKNKLEYHLSVIIEGMPLFDSIFAQTNKCKTKEEAEGLIEQHKKSISQNIKPSVKYI